MKKSVYLLSIFAMLFLFSTNIAWAQFDDLYYNPENDTQGDGSISYNYSDDDYYDDEYSYDDGYDYYDDYDYTYSNRIKRFHRSNYYNYYDPFFYDDYYSYNNYYSPYNYYNPFYFSWVPSIRMSFSFGNYYPYYNRYYYPYYSYNYYYPGYYSSWNYPYYYSGYYGGYGYNSYYNNNYWYGDSYNNWNSNSNKHYGSRRSISSVSPKNTKDHGIVVTGRDKVSDHNVNQGADRKVSMDERSSGGINKSSGNRDSWTPFDDRKTNSRSSSDYRGDYGSMNKDKGTSGNNGDNRVNDDMRAYNNTDSYRRTNQENTRNSSRNYNDSSQNKSSRNYNNNSSSQKSNSI
ncbi:MAG: hypothetical protein R2771_08670 [Saprospiraceae bacterium]